MLIMRHPNPKNHKLTLHENINILYKDTFYKLSKYSTRIPSITLPYVDVRKELDMHFCDEYQASQIYEEIIKDMIGFIKTIMANRAEILGALLFERIEHITRLVLTRMQGMFLEKTWGLGRMLGMVALYILFEKYMVVYLYLFWLYLGITILPHQTNKIKDCRVFTFCFVLCAKFDISGKRTSEVKSRGLLVLITQII
ncbi:hypothetical protein ACJX0J_029187, partial [Zea mays]